MQQQKLWLVKSGCRVPEAEQMEFLIVGFNKFNARLNAEDYVMQSGQRLWADLMITKATADDTIRLLGPNISDHILGKREAVSAS